MSNKNSIDKFKAASKIIQSTLNVGEIAEAWNATQLGKPAKEQTVKRWLNVGPKTKNPRFEPWVIELTKEKKKCLSLEELKAAFEKPECKKRFPLLSDNLNHQMTFLIEAREMNGCASKRQSVTIGTLALIAEELGIFSVKQENMIDSMCDHLLDYHGYTCK